MRLLGPSAPGCCGLLLAALWTDPELILEVAEDVVALYALYMNHNMGLAKRTNKSCNYVKVGKGEVSELLAE
mgnify:CR=1 FL=1